VLQEILEGLQKALQQLLAVGIHQKPAKLKRQGVLKPWEQRVDALRQGVEAALREEEPLVRLLEQEVNSLNNPSAS
tara:strand:+ start:189 stop:416 length:228 start_codon:yes stop_codon:yes gene_type:complete